VANDISISQNGGPRNISIVTGPNMGGKSTYVRMVAILAIMGQMGCYLPCESAQLVVFDSIWTRMGADDDLANGMSTFLVELDHCSRILRSVTSQSLVILDELGRGTATHDGVAVAKATLLYLVKELKCATLFVTHYPQICEVAFSQDCATLDPSPLDVTCFVERQRQTVNLHMDFLLPDSSTKNRDSKDVVFLYKAIEGWTDSSHGLNVARIAGLPPHLMKIALWKVEEQKRRDKNVKTVASSGLTVDVTKEQSVKCSLIRHKTLSKDGKEGEDKVDVDSVYHFLVETQEEHNTVLK